MPLTQLEANAKHTIAKAVSNAAETAPPQCVEVNNTRAAITALFQLATGSSIKKAAEASGLNRMTVKALDQRHSDVLKHIKKALIANMASTAYAGTQVLAKKFQQLNDDPDALAKANPKDIAIATGVAVDKSLTLNGDPTAIHETKHSVSLNDYKEAIRQARGRVLQGNQNGETCQHLETNNHSEHHCRELSSRSKHPAGSSRGSVEVLEGESERAED